MKEDKKEISKLKKELAYYKYLSAQYEMMLDHIPALIFYKDTKNNFIRVNKYVAEAHNLNKKDLEGKNIFEIYPKVDAEKYYQDDLEVIKSGVPKLNFVEPWETKDGLRWVSTSKIPFIDENGQIIGIIGISIDATEKQLYENELKRKNEELILANSEKEKFFEIIAHDLRNPISNCMNIINLLSSEMSDLSDNDKKILLANLNTSAKRIYKLLENLLQWALLKQGHLQYSPAIIKLNDIIIETKELLAEQARQKEIEIVIDSQINIVYADKNMISTVLRNIVSNSIKFSHKGGKIYVKTDITDKNKIQVSVIDNGIGIPKYMINNLFILDKKTNRKGTANEPSTGLGLHLCKELIELNKGKIFVESDGESWTKVSFTLPTGEGQM